MKFRAVSRDRLIATLGSQCSPMHHREGYVIGPDYNGRLCHIATCHSMAEAVATAKKLNTEE